MGIKLRVPNKSFSGHHDLFIMQISKQQHLEIFSDVSMGIVRKCQNIVNKFNYAQKLELKIELNKY